MDSTETNSPPEVKIEKLVYGGAGLARMEGRIVLTPFVVPGETVRVDPRSERRGLVEANLLEVIERAPERTEPPCPHFTRCGGCQYQHMTYAAQLEQKVVILREVFRRVGKLDAPERIGVISAEPWQYRNRAQLHIAEGRIGYFGHGTHRLVSIDQCPLASPKLNEVIGAVARMISDRRFPHFLRTLELFTNETDVQLNAIDTNQPIARRFFDWCTEAIPGFAPAAIEYAAAGETFRVRRNSFFQVNRFLAGRMVEAATEGAEGDFALDLYAGVGLFALPLARRFGSVTAVESGAQAAGDLEFNAARAGLDIAVARSDVEEYLESAERTPDFVLADPPRAGLGKHAVKHLLRLRPRRLTIVACDPATLARDLAPLTESAYRVESLDFIDLFPQTFHIEAVAKLRLAAE
jgi:23S rRNA (uracil1939-C5)-methyltransferase